MSHDRRRVRRSRRVIGAVVTSAVLAVYALDATAEPSVPAGSSMPSTATADKIQPVLLTELSSGDATDFWIYFDAKADLSSAGRIENWDERGRAVADALKSTAASSQETVTSRLAAEGVDFQAFWATNAIKVEDGSLELAERLASHAEVDSVHPSFHVEIPEPTTGHVIDAASTVEWGIENINADDVWNEYDAHGEGIVVANIDSGVQFDHPALVHQYRGNNGDGTFDHNYNWFDATGAGIGHPVDHDDHGTHTMGTMVGDDSAGNQIGVAPGATWVAANGCCASDATLVASGQWMLEPTDLNGDNPDATKRPHIINNSWGTENPSNAPFMEDLSAAWQASGIFATWSNGNNGDRCRTSGSPGSRTINYSVGAYDSDNTIAGFSSRGTGQDGEIKPNISAPGVNVRSSVRGNLYAAFNGTSMAAPHVAGAIALLWSAAPGIVGDVATTTGLLDGTAIDQPDDQCGGTDDDNNVFGEGRLDALALVDSAPTGPAGTLRGTITDAATGDPVPGAAVTVIGPVRRELTAATDGTFDDLLPTGDYTVRVSKYLFEDQTATVTVTSTGATVDVAMESVPTATITGTVLDGSGHGWPLYAEVTIDGEATLADFTDPVTGDYAIKVPTGTTWNLTVTSQYDGYEAATAAIDVGTSDVVHDVDLLVHSARCEAAGYALGPIEPVLAEDFAAGELPAGWTVEDHHGNGETWVFDDVKNRGNRTGGEGAFAVIDSESYFLSTQNTSLVTPAIDLTDADSVALVFSQDYKAHRNDTYADIDVSVDGGATWETVQSQTGLNAPGPQVAELAAPQAAGHGEVKVRWRYGGSFGYFWQVDDVVVGTRSCDPVDAGLILGQVSDRNTGAAVTGATVTSVDDPGQTVTTKATPDDPTLGDGFWWMVSGATGEGAFTATAAEYAEQTIATEVRDHGITTIDFVLAAGLVTVDTRGVESTVELGESDTGTFTVTNEGSAPVEVELSGRDGTFEILGGGGGDSTSLRQLDSADAVPTAARRPLASWQPEPGEDSDDESPGFGPSGLDPDRSSMPVRPDVADDEVTITHSVSQELMVNSQACVGNGSTSAAGFLRVFDLEAFDVTSDFDVTQVSFGVEAARGAQKLTVNLYTLDGELVYDNLTPIGSAETTLEPQEFTMVTVPVAGTAPKGSTLVVELASPDLGAIGASFFPGSNNLGQTGPTYLRAEDCGTPEPVPTDQLGFPGMHLVMNVTGEPENTVPWLVLSAESVSLAPGESAQVTVTMDASVVDQPGTYTGRVRVSEDTPYEVPPVRTSMAVTPPRTWGKIVGVVTGTSCRDDTAAIADATVQLDWRSGYRTLYTDADGAYAYWLDLVGSPYTMVVAKDGYRPVVDTVRIKARKTLTMDVTLQQTRC